MAWTILNVAPGKVKWWGVQWPRRPSDSSASPNPSVRKLDQESVSCIVKAPMEWATILLKYHFWLQMLKWRDSLKIKHVELWCCCWGVSAEKEWLMIVFSMWMHQLLTFVYLCSIWWFHLVSLSICIVVLLPQGRKWYS